MMKSVISIKFGKVWLKWYAVNEPGPLHTLWFNPITNIYSQSEVLLIFSADVYNFEFI